MDAVGHLSPVSGRDNCLFPGHSAVATCIVVMRAEICFLYGPLSIGVALLESFARFDAGETIKVCEQPFGGNCQRYG